MKQSIVLMLRGAKVAQMLTNSAEFLLIVTSKLIIFELTNILTYFFPQDTLRDSKCASLISYNLPVLDMMQIPALLLSDLLMGYPNLFQVLVEVEEGSLGEATRLSMINYPFLRLYLRVF